ncbi:MAG TPA: FHA domain-containing protein [Vicinamibacterales bacterium]
MTSPSPPDAIPRRPGGDLIEAVVENMRRNLEPLKYTVLAPSRYVVYLHPDEFARFEGILPVLQAQTVRALDEAIQKLNATPVARRMLDRVLGSPPPVQNPAREWQVEFVPDPDGEVGHGDILIHSELLLPSREELGAGQRTRRVATVHVGTCTTVRQEVSSTTGASSRPVARLKYTDDAGAHVFDMVTDAISIGRGGAAYRVDVRIASSEDVSREHLRIRRDASGRFYVSDLSMLGTTVNGTRLPKGYQDVDGERRPNGLETPVPAGARIGLADTIYLSFDVLDPATGRQ